MMHGQKNIKIYFTFMTSRYRDLILKIKASENKKH